MYMTSEIERRAMSDGLPSSTEAPLRKMSGSLNSGRLPLFVDRQKKDHM
jgi:hypothetical protein